MSANRNRAHLIPPYRNVNSFERAMIVLESDETAGQVLSNYDGEYNYFLATFGANVKIQKRVPAIVDIIKGNAVETAEVERTIVSASDYDAVTEVHLATAADTFMLLHIDANEGTDEELPVEFIRGLEAGTTVIITQSSTVWTGSYESLTHVSGNEFRLLIDFPTDQRVGTFTNDQTVMISFGEILASTAWRDVATITNTEDERTDFIALSRNYEYRFTTATAGSIMYLSDIWFNRGFYDG